MLARGGTRRSALSSPEGLLHREAYPLPGDPGRPGTGTGARAGRGPVRGGSVLFLLPPLPLREASNHSDGSAPQGPEATAVLLLCSLHWCQTELGRLSNRWDLSISPISLFLALLLPPSLKPRDDSPTPLFLVSTDNRLLRHAGLILA